MNIVFIVEAVIRLFSGINR